MKSSLILYKEGVWKGLDIDLKMKENAQCVLVFVDTTLLSSDFLYVSLKQHFTKASIVFCSTAGEIFQQEIEENSAVCMVMYFEKTNVLCASGNIGLFEDAAALGKSVASSLLRDDLKHILVLSDGNRINGDLLVEGIYEAVGSTVKVSGGLAGDAVRFEKTLVGLDNDVAEGNIVLIGFYGNSIKIGTGFRGGWDVFGPERIITKSNGNVLSEIDNSNALDLYKLYLGKYANELPSTALLFPLSVKYPGTDIFVVRTILSIDEQNKTMTFAGNMPKGSTVRFMKSNADRLILAASEAGKESVLGLDKSNIEAALVVSCIGRKIVLSDRAEEEVEAVLENFAPETVVAGFFSYGEIAPYDNKKRSVLHNQTITITTFSELP